MKEKRIMKIYMILKKNYIKKQLNQLKKLKKENTKKWKKEPMPKLKPKPKIKTTKLNGMKK